jgi:hypothetical protein
MAGGLAGPKMSPANNPLTYSAGGSNQAISALNNALNSNAQAYQGLENQAQQQYQTNAGGVQANLANRGLGNTTVAETMAQAPLQTLNNSLLNITGQQQGQAANIYGQQANTFNQSGNSLANLMMALNQQGLQQQQIGNQYAEATAAPQVRMNGI